MKNPHYFNEDIAYTIMTKWDLPKKEATKHEESYKTGEEDIMARIVEYI